jgi:hypothetical protein
LEAKTGGRRSPDWTAGWRCGSLSNVARVRIAELLANAAVDPAAHLDRRRVERYAEALDTLPPVVVFQTEVGLLIADGYHRVAAAQAKGLDTIEAHIRTGSLRDALPMPWPSEPVSGTSRRKRFCSASATARKDAGGVPPIRNSFPRPADLGRDSGVRPGRQCGHQMSSLSFWARPAPSHLVSRKCR